MKLPNDGNASGRNFGERELTLLKEVLDSGTLNSTKGTMVKRLQQAFAEQYGIAHCLAMSSGTAALHTAIAALDLEPGDEIITTAITDMGAITPILYQGAIPVFADVDPQNYNITADSIASQITERTRAVIVTHLFGYPCDMGPILDLSRAHNLLIIEDAAQAYYAEWQGQRVGTMGDIGCFSLQQGKHMTTGEGGLTVTNNPDLERRMRLFVDKAWGYGDEKPDHYFLALNYRMTELQGAVALAQFEKVTSVVQNRRTMAAELDGHLSSVQGIAYPVCVDGDKHVYWKYPLTVDTDCIGIDVDALAGRLNELGVASAPRYIRKPAFECQVLKDRVTLGKSGYPFSLRPDLTPARPEDYPGTMQALAHILVLPWNENYTTEHVQFITSTIKESLK
jgi:dTDP-4-amino-4,6-dideoxygalactose transaminase